MQIFKSKIFLALFCFSLGIAVVLLAQKLLANDEFFDRAHDPFEEMRKMRGRMMKDFDQPFGDGGLFDSWYKKRFGGGDAGEITKREDKDFIYYDIVIKDLNKDKLNVKIANGQIDISGQIEKKSEENGNHSYFSSSFHRSFPAPPNVDSDKVKIEPIKERLVLKFPKVS